jgi:hypothetical protein
VTDRAASITWTRPQGDNITYKVYLNNELVEDNFGQTAYTFTGLSAETNYNGKITATNGNQSTSAELSFKTETFTLRTFIGDAVLHTQGEVNEFGSNHYNIIDGRLEISRYDPISSVVDLSPLHDLIKITNNVRIQNTSLEDFEGLNNLKEIGGFIEIRYNDNLISVNGLEKLESIDDYLYFQGNPILNNVDGMLSLNSVQGVNFYYNLSLETVNFLNEATSGSFIIFDDNPSIKTISGFRNMKTLSSDLIINNNIALLNFSGLNSIETVNGVLDIIGNENLEYLSLESLKTVGRDLEIVGNNKITKLDGINKVMQVNDGLWIGNNIELSDLCGISYLMLNGGVQDNIQITNNLYNPTLEDFINGDCNL